MTDTRIKLDSRCNRRVYVVASLIPVPSIKVEVMYVDEAGDDDAYICRVETDNLTTITELRDALNQILGE